MKSLTKIFGSSALILATVSPALAAGARQDSSGLVVWAFLGFCALILVAQLVPALLMLFGMVKGLTTSHDTLADTSTKTGQ